MRQWLTERHGQPADPLVDSIAEGQPAIVGVNIRTLRQRKE